MGNKKDKNYSLLSVIKYGFIASLSLMIPFYFLERRDHEYYYGNPKLDSGAIILLLLFLFSYLAASLLSWKFRRKIFLRGQIPIWLAVSILGSFLFAFIPCLYGVIFNSTAIKNLNIESALYYIAYYWIGVSIYTTLITVTF